MPRTDHIARSPAAGAVPGSIPSPLSYSGFLNRIALPAYSRLRGRSYSQHRLALEESQWWTPQQLAEFQFAELRKVLKVAFESVPFYQKKYAAAGVRLSDIQSLDDLRKLPPLERDEIREHRAELTNPNFPGALLPHSTGGSSGSPTRFFITRESYDWRTACTDRAYAWAGAVLGRRVLYLWGAAVGQPSLRRRLTTGFYSAYRRELKINTFTQPEGFWSSVLDQALAYKPVAIVAYTSNLEQFCAEALRRNVRIPSLRSVLTAAEPVYPLLYDTVQNALGVPLFNTYGSREFMSIAVECPQHHGLHINAENILLETDTREPGLNELLVTDLHNLGMPFIRYRVGDAATLDATPCPCGRGLPRLRSIEGRLLDQLRTTDGRIVPGEVIPHVMKDLPEVISFQAEQTALDALVFRFVLSTDLSAASRDLLLSEMRKAFGSGTNFTIERVAEIPRRASGKRRVVIGLESA